MLEKCCNGTMAKVRLGSDQHDATSEELQYRNRQLHQEHTAHRVIEQERAQLLIESQAALTIAEQAVQVREQLFAIAAHDLKTPLAAMLGNTQLLQMRTRQSQALNERDRHTLAVILEQGLRLNLLIDTLFDLTQLQGGRIQLVRVMLDLQALLRRLVEETQLTLEQQKIELISDDVPLMIHADVQRLEQVFHNLITNAIKYSPQGKPVQVQILRRATQACVIVQDQGIGISVEGQQHLFELFYRETTATSHLIGGAGIGLYIVNEIVSLHDGTVQVESREGLGSTFTILLPLLALEPAYSEYTPS
jgi:signal transduction histidine kinase